MSVFYDLSKTPRNILNQAIVRAIVSENNGALFDPSDMSTLYRDAAGTIPVTAVEQPVGLMLDKSMGLMLGPELVSNGDFSNGSAGWSLGTGWSVPALSAVFTGANAGELRQNILTVGRMYKIEFDVAVNAQYIGLLSGSLTPQTIINTSGHKTLYLTATSSVFSVYAGKNANIVLDNISVRELYGYHATQSITASRPTLSARKNILLATETLATQSVATLAATYTLSFTGTGSVTLSGTSTGTLTGNGTDRVSLTFTPTAGTLTLTVSGSVTKAQLGLGSVVTSYQRVTTATDYDVSAHYYYLRFDGIDDYLVLPYMGLYANGSASVVVSGELDTSVSTHRVIQESSSAAEAPMYSLRTFTSPNSGFGIAIANDAGTLLLVQNKAIPSGALKVLSCVDNGTSVKAAINSTDIQIDSYARSGSLTLNNTTIGAKVSVATSGYMPAKLYGIIITKSALTDSQRVACERYLGRKSGVQL